MWVRAMHMRMVKELGTIPVRIKPEKDIAA